jgi:hypothetical protein
LTRYALEKKREEYGFKKLLIAHDMKNFDFSEYIKSNPFYKSKSAQNILWEGYGVKDEIEKLPKEAREKFNQQAELLRRKAEEAALLQKIYQQQLTEAAKQQMLAAYQGINDLFDVIKLAGQELDIPQLQKVGVIGQQLTSMHKSIALIT